jgi:RNA polymerase sigma factor (sigma-70 family)
MTQDEMLQEHYSAAARTVAAEARRWRVNPDDVEDIFQRTMAKIVQYPIDFTGARNPEGLFFSSVKRACQRELYTYRGFRGNGKSTGVSKAKRDTFAAGLFQALDREDANVLDERMLPLMPSAEDAFFHDHRFDALWDAVDGLSPLQRTTMTLRYREELDVADIALRLGISEQKVNWTVAEGLRKLRRRMNPGKAGYPSAKLGERRKVSA